MLKLAYPYKDVLGRWRCEHGLDEHFKFYTFANWLDFEQPLENSTWNAIEMVSLDVHGEIIGFFSANINRTANVVKGLACLNMTGHTHPTFSRDMVEFIGKLLFYFNFSKICFSVLVGNPAESMYDKVVDRFGGRVVGVRKDHIRIMDGTLRDEKLYEIQKKDIDLGELAPLLQKLDLKIV